MRRTINSHDPKTCTLMIFERQFRIRARIRKIHDSARTSSPIFGIFQDPCTRESPEIDTHGLPLECLSNVHTRASVHRCALRVFCTAHRTSFNLNQFAGGQEHHEPSIVCPRTVVPADGGCMSVKSGLCDSCLSQEGYLRRWFMFPSMAES